MVVRITGVRLRWIITCKMVMKVYLCSVLLSIKFDLLESLMFNKTTLLKLWTWRYQSFTKNLKKKEVTNNRESLFLSPCLFLSAESYSDSLRKIDGLLLRFVSHKSPIIQLLFMTVTMSGDIQRGENVAMTTPSLWPTVPTTLPVRLHLLRLCPITLNCFSQFMYFIFVIFSFFLHMRFFFYMLDTFYS